MACGPSKVILSDIKNSGFWGGFRLVFGKIFGLAGVINNKNWLEINYSKKKDKIGSCFTLHTVSLLLLKTKNGTGNLLSRI